MEFLVFFFISWLVISSLAVIKKKMNLVEGTFIFLIILILSINFSWIVIDELKLITVTKKALPYTAYLLHRSVIIPNLILLFLNLLIRSETLIMKTILFIFSTFLLVAVSFISTILNVTEFKNWTFWYETIYYLALNLIAMLSYRFINKTSRDEVHDQ
ncbi:hypothetical protein SAMN05877753_10442 [Bacillus oleivorans]|uniref:Uncharacterized protein n=1 Tax=Bacillus oleivorans TaxID=1448271 RepID=A0A285CRV7_9BACI|nr:hypothetical protein SAMN05877753_10442 [Bacillus oleivorans]